MAVKIIGTTSGAEADVHSTAKALRVISYDSSGNIIDFGGFPTRPATGGFYTVGGGTSAVVAASLAANTPLMAMRFSAGSTRKAYIEEFKVLFTAGTSGTSGLVAGTMGLRRFTTATHTGGTARTVNKLEEAADSTTDMTDVRDSNAALTETSVVYGNTVAVEKIALMALSTFEWIIRPQYPIVLAAGDGLALRTIDACPATQTWQYSYTVNWREK